MPTNSILSHSRVRQYFALSLILILFLFLLFSLQEFITAFLGAMIFYVLFRNFMLRLIQQYKWKRWGAATLIILISFMVIMVPMFSLLYILFTKVQLIFSNSDSVLSMYHSLIERINSFAGRVIIDSNTITEITKNIASNVPGILTGSLNLMGSILMMYFLLFYLLVNVGKVEPAFFRFIPFSAAGIKMLTSELRSMTYSNAIAVPLIAACQGVVASIGFIAFGLDDPWFWGIMCGCTSIIPVVGAGLIWIPAGLYLLGTDVAWHGIAVLSYGVLVISTVDNIFRFMFGRWFADVHPVITILGVVVGLKWFGLPGLVFGPLLISYFFLLLKIYKKDYVDEEV